MEPSTSSFDEGSGNHRYILDTVRELIAKEKLSDVFVLGNWVREKLINSEILGIDLVYHSADEEKLVGGLEKAFKSRGKGSNQKMWIKEKKDRVSKRPNDKSIKIHSFYLSCADRSQIAMELRPLEDDKIEHDVNLTDFTVNGIYYDVKKKAIVDPAGGVKDLKDKVLRCVGPPEKSIGSILPIFFRMVRFAAEDSLALDKKLNEYIKTVDFAALGKQKFGDDTSSIPTAVAIQKVFGSRKNVECLKLMKSFGIHKFFMQDCDKIEEFEQIYDSVGEQLEKSSSLFEDQTSKFLITEKGSGREKLIPRRSNFLLFIYQLFPLGDSIAEKLIQNFLLPDNVGATAKEYVEFFKALNGLKFPPLPEKPAKGERIKAFENYFRILKPVLNFNKFEFEACTAFFTKKLGKNDLHPFIDSLTHQFEEKFSKVVAVDKQKPEKKAFQKSSNPFQAFQRDSDSDSETK